MSNSILILSQHYAIEYNNLVQLTTVHNQILIDIDIDIELYIIKWSEWRDEWLSARASDIWVRIKISW